MKQCSPHIAKYRCSNHVENKGLVHDIPNDEGIVITTRVDGRSNWLHNSASYMHKYATFLNLVSDVILYRLGALAAVPHKRYFAGVEKTVRQLQFVRCGSPLLVCVFPFATTDSTVEHCLQRVPLVSGTHTYCLLTRRSSLRTTRRLPMSD